MIIDVRRKKSTFRLELYGKYNIITGKSGTRKTDFVNSLFKFKRGLRGVSVSIVTDTGSKLTKEDLIIFTNDTIINADYNKLLEQSQNKLIVIDEFSDILRMPDIARVLKNSQNYFIIITRKLFGWLPISGDSIYELENDKGIIVNKAVYYDDDVRRELVHDN